MGKAKPATNLAPEEALNVLPADIVQDDAVADIYALGGGVEDMLWPDDSQTVKLTPVRKSVVPWQVGVAGYARGDKGNLRNLTDPPNMQNYDYRIHALTLVNNGPEYYGIVQHVMQENAERFSVKTAQTVPLPVDVAATLPYNAPEDLVNQ